MRGVPDIIDGIGEVDQVVRRNASFDPGRQELLTSEHHELWARIDGQRTVRDVILGSHLSPIRGVALIRQLHRWGAIQVGALDCPTETGDFDIVDATDLGALTTQEAALLEEPVELAPWEKRRILAFVRMIRQRRLLDVLGIQANASKREIKRAYYELSKEFHPDRYYGKRLGGFAPLLDQIFEAAADTVKQLSARTMGPGEPRRRISERYPFACRLRLRAESWSGPVELASNDVGERGMFIPTNLAATAGERLVMEVTLPSGGTVPLRGRVAWYRPESEAARANRLPGLGIELSPMNPSERVRYEVLLDAARRQAPAPADTADEANAEEGGAVVARARIARGSGPIRRLTPVVGIDFGTTYTCVSASLGNRVRVLPWPDGRRAIPSVISFPSRGQHVVGRDARDRLLYDPKHSLASIKRLLGRRIDDPIIETHLAQAPYRTSPGPDGGVLVEMWGEGYAVPQLCSYLIRAAKSVAEHALGEAVDRAVFTVPVSFDPARVALLRRAAELAHLEAVEIIDEPSAAALANRYRPDFGGIIGVYDFGGGTFDFSIVDASAGDFRVLATHGDSWLGGDDLDFAVAEAVANQFWRVTGVDVRTRAVEWQALLFACERAKRELSTADVAQVLVPEVYRDSRGSHDLRMRLRRDPVETLWAPPVRRTLEACMRALVSVGLQPTDLAAVYLSGGTSYVPAVRRSLQQVLKVPVRVGVPPEFAACLGAGIHAAQLERKMDTTLRAVADAPA